MTTLPRSHELERIPCAGQPAAGRVIGVRGTVVEVEFGDDIPPLGVVLYCQHDGDRQITAVVHSHLNRSTVQAIAAVPGPHWTEIVPVLAVLWAWSPVAWESHPTIPIP
jgi:hypothetical protein